MFGYNSKAIHIDLSSEKISVVDLSRDFCRKYIGGSGFIARYLLDKVPRNVDPFSPENVLIFASGPFCATRIPSTSKYAVGSKSPQTGFFGDAVSSSWWSERLRQAGFDLIAIRGKAKQLKFIMVDNGKVTIENARDLRGLSTRDTEKEVKSKLGDSSFSVASIGIAGENEVRYACICNDNREAGRAGIGAVMGSKNLKAVAVRGDKKIEVSKPEELGHIAREMTRELARGEGVKGYRDCGTLGDVEEMNAIGSLPSQNWRCSTFEGAEGLAWNSISKKWRSKKRPCSHCPISCSRAFMIDDGEYRGSWAVMDYEPTYAFGPCCGVDYYPSIVRALELCDCYGIDAITTGLTISWAMECYENGLISKESTGGFELKFGNYHAMLQAISLIAERRGIGKLLAEGSKRASEKLGKGSERFAIHSKGLEFPGFEARGLKAAGFGFAISARGGCHVRSGGYDLNLKNMVDRLETGPKLGPMIMETEDFSSLVDSLLICRFTRGVWPTFEEKFSGLAKLYELTTGFETPPAELRRVAERITNMKKIFNLRQGWKRKDDSLPPRLSEPLPDGPMKGARITQEELDGFLDSYYSARGWTVEGIPTRAKLEHLELTLDN
jgi:aldehyde:ferredoxin oxidoreductase